MIGTKSGSPQLVNSLTTSMIDIGAAGLGIDGLVSRSRSRSTSSNTSSISRIGSGKFQLEALPTTCPSYRCGGISDGVTPVYGKFGSYFNPALKKVKENPKYTKPGNQLRLKNKAQISKAEKNMRLFPSAPKQYLGPHNTMWDPHVRRGSCVVPFNELEKHCSIPDRWSKRSRNKNLPTTKNPMFQIKGTIIYPEVVLGQKQELTDFSQFLEEQEEEIEEGTGSGQTKSRKGYPKTKMSESQTEDEIRHTESERDELMALGLWEGKPFSPRNRYKRNYHAGVCASTQVDNFHLGLDMGQLINPITSSIHRISSVITKQLISQSLLESMEASELGQIRAQSDALDLWIMQEQHRVAKENRDLCKKMARLKLEADIEAEWEKRFEDLKKHVDATLLSGCVVKNAMGAVFDQLESIGVLGEDVEAACIGAWVHKCVTKIVVRNKEIARDVLDDIIDNGTNKRPSRSLPLLYNSGPNFQGEATEDEGGSIISTGNFGEDDGENEEIGTEYEGHNLSYDEKLDKGLVEDATEGVREDKNDKKKSKSEPPVVHLLSPKF